jgi:hypothetical protein
VTLKVTDNEGCSTETVFTGQTVSCAGNPLASVTVPLKVLPERGPKLQVVGSDRQGLRKVVVRARCPQVACSLKAGGVVVTATEDGGRKIRHTRRLGSASAPTMTRGWRRLVVRVPGSTRSGAERALLAGGTAKARVAVIARNRANELTEETEVVKLGF